jgi:hypothetical protein
LEADKKMGSLRRPVFAGCTECLYLQEMLGYDFLRDQGTLGDEDASISRGMSCKIYRAVMPSKSCILINAAMDHP